MFGIPKHFFFYKNKKDVTTTFDKVMTSDLINNIIKYEIAY